MSKAKREMRDGEKLIHLRHIAHEIDHIDNEVETLSHLLANLNFKLKPEIARIREALDAADKLVGLQITKLTGDEG